MNRVGDLNGIASVKGNGSKRTHYNKFCRTIATLVALVAVLLQGCVTQTTGGFNVKRSDADALRDYLQLAASSEWISGKSLHARATGTPRALGTVQIPRAAPLITQAYLYCKPPRGRQRLTVQGRPRKSAQSLKRAHSERTPWLLLSKLPRRYKTAKRVVE